MDVFHAFGGQPLGERQSAAFRSEAFYFEKGDGVENAVGSLSYGDDAEGGSIALSTRRHGSSKFLLKSTLAVIASISVAVMLILLCGVSRSKVKQVGVRRLSDSGSGNSSGRTSDECENENVRQYPDSSSVSAFGRTSREQSSSSAAVLGADTEGREGSSAQEGESSLSQSSIGAGSRISSRKRRRPGWGYSSFLSESPSAHRAKVRVYSRGEGTSAAASSSDESLENQPSTSAAGLMAESSGDSSGFQALEGPSTSTAADFKSFLEPWISPSSVRLPRVRYAGPRERFSPDLAMSRRHAVHWTLEPFRILVSLLNRESLGRMETRILIEAAQQMVRILISHERQILINLNPDEALKALARRYLAFRAVVCALMVLQMNFKKTQWWQQITASVPHEYPMFLPDVAGIPQMPLAVVMISRLIRSLDILKAGYLPEDEELSRLLLTLRPWHW